MCRNLAAETSVVLECVETAVAVDVTSAGVHCSEAAAAAASAVVPSVDLVAGMKTVDSRVHLELAAADDVVTHGSCFEEISG